MKYKRFLIFILIIALFFTVFSFPQQKSFAESSLQYFTSEHDLLVLSDLSYINFDESDKGNELGEILSDNQNVAGQVTARLMDNLTFNGVMQERQINSVKDWLLIDIEDDNHSTGFYGLAFQHKYTKEVVIAFRGSENGIESLFKEGGEDWRYDILVALLQFQMGSKNQFVPAREFVREVINKVNRDKSSKIPTISLTGHSLGGFLAQRLAIDLERNLMEGVHNYHFAKAVTFNAPGFLPPNLLTNSLLDQIIHELRIKPGEYITGIEYIDRKNYHVKNYVVSGDLVGSLGNVIGNADVIDGHVGETVYLDYYDLISNGTAIIAVTLESWLYKFSKVDIGSSDQRHALTNFYKTPFDIDKDFKAIKLLDEYGEVIEKAEVSVYLNNQLISIANEVGSGVYRFSFFESNNLPLTIEVKAQGFKESTFVYKLTKDFTPEFQLEFQLGYKEIYFLEKAKKAFDNGDYLKTLEFVNKSIEIKSTYENQLLKAEVLLNLGLAKKDNKILEDALMAVQNSLEIHDSAEGTLLKGLTLYHLGRCNEALDVFIKVLKMNNDDTHMTALVYVKNIEENSCKKEDNEETLKYIEFPHQKDVPKDKIWTISFNKEVDVKREDFSIISEEGKKINTISVRVLPGKKSVELKNSEDYEAGNTYWLLISKETSSTEGQSLKLPVKLSFTIKEEQKDPSQIIVTIPDPYLELVIRKEINKPNGDLTRADMLEITAIDAFRKNIQNLSGLEYATNLRTLKLEENNISDISALSGLIWLRYLILSNNNIDNIYSLVNLNRLSHLDLSGNEVENLDPLRGLISLETLNLGRNKIKDISALSDLVNLRSLVLRENEITEISPLSNLTKLENLHLFQNNIHDISTLSKLLKLSSLTLHRNQISDVSPLSGLIKLFQLDLSENQIKDIRGLETLIKMRTLRLANNEISDVNPLRNLINLEMLYLHYNKISDISSLSGLPKLWYIGIAHNPISRSVEE